MAKFATPEPKKKYQIEIDRFAGADLSNAPNNVALFRSPSCPNMIRDTVGKVRKRNGIALVKTYDGKINGVHFLNGAVTQKLVHSGTKMYLDGETPALLRVGINDHISVSVQMSGKLWIFDGYTAWVYDGTTLESIYLSGKIPTILIARAPTGGGTVLEEINLLNPKMTVLFSGTAGATVYYLPHTGITAGAGFEPVVEKMNSSGIFEILTVTTHYTVQHASGAITFVTAPGVPPITGEDNVRITYSKTITGYSERINACDICFLYGLNGARNMVFVSGNPNLPHYDFHCAINDPSYFGDLSYSVIGQDNAAIVGYSVINDSLVTHKENEENNSNANIREGSLVGGKVVFASKGSYPTVGALAKHSFANLENEPLYLTADKNISAVTPSDVLGERFSQERSYYITKALEKETDLANAYAYVFDGFYCLATGATIYILDGSQATLEKNRPYSQRQYECYYFPGISATVLWSENGELHFGTADGKIKRFDAASYNDEGSAVSAYWDTPELDGGSFADKKTFTYVGARVASAVRTALQVSAKIQGLWKVVMPYNNEARYLDFNDVDFGNFTFSTDTTPHTLGAKIKEKNVDKAQFRFENSRLGEPFGLYKAIIEYAEGNKYRK